VKKHPRLVMAVALLLVLPLIQLGANITPVAASPSGTLSIGLSSLPDILDPALANPITKLDITPMFDYLVGTNQAGTALSATTGIASSWSNVNLTTWTFDLKSGITFSDGSALTSADVVFSLNRVLAATGRSSFGPYLRSIVTSVTAPDPNTVVIVLNAPNFSLPFYLSQLQGTEGMVVPMAYVQKVGAAGFALNPIGSGPYVLSAQTPGQSLSYTARPGVNAIWGTPKFQTVTFTQSADESSRIAGLRTKEFDLVDFDATVDNPASMHKLGFQTFTSLSQAPVAVSFQDQFAKGNILGNVAFRRALAYSINYKQINKVLFHGAGTVSGDGGPPEIGFIPLKVYGYQPKLAKTLLKRSGYKHQAVTIYVFALAGSINTVNLDEALAGYWEAIGVKVSLQPIDYATIRAEELAHNLPSGVTVGGGGAGADRFQGVDDAIYFSCAGLLEEACTPAMDKLLATVHGDFTSQASYAKAMAPVQKYIYNNVLAVDLLDFGAHYAGDSKVNKAWILGNGVFGNNIMDVLTTK
jgi:peptide/nickel transport system substrate-binding protein